MTASTANHLWSLQDLLGQGATACVYKGRNKKTGEVVALKVFNMASYSRPYEVQLREFEMLRKLSHVNIVKLFSVEELHANPKQKVLVMELCSGGSLLNLLEEPENAFGLPESEFLIVLQCVVHGMNHLREKGVVHRDIKPGNIMRQLGEDGHSVYKLTDFGAARELEDDEKFMSIYGTEEYLHPDMYERAVLRKPQQKTYGVTVDLWSIGVTFYHAATGGLPFIPYGGPRKNKQTMYKITTEKPEGAISGVQKNEDGPIEWIYQLPHSCQLSEGLKMRLVPVLANILEANQERCWGFERFCAATMDILQCLKVHVFSLQQATAHTIFIHFHNTASILFEEVQARTGIQVDMQRYQFLGHPLTLEPSMKVVNLPPNTAEQPLYLISRQAEKIAALPPREPESPVLPSRFDLVADHSFSRTMVGVIHQYLRTVCVLHKHRELVLGGECLHTECNNAAHGIAMVNMKLLSCLTAEETLDALSQIPLDLPHSTDSMQKLRRIQESLPVYGSSIRDFQAKLHHLHVELARYSEILAQDKSIQKLQVLLGKISGVHEHYRADKKMRQLTYNDEQIHKFEKINLSTYIKKVKVLFRDDCLQKYQEILAAVMSWSSEVHDIQSKLEQFSCLFMQIIGDLQLCEGHQMKVVDRALVIALQRPAAGEETDTLKNRDHMILRMKRLKNEMETVAQELHNNNCIIESLEVVNCTLVMEPGLSSSQGS